MQEESSAQPSALVGPGAGVGVQRVPRRVVSGMRPTGKLHLGHFHGAIKNWIEISRKAECFFFSADWHALTTD